MIYPFLLGHELCHPFDPVQNVRQKDEFRGLDLFNAFDKTRFDSKYIEPELLKCLRDPKSVEAKQVSNPADLGPIGQVLMNFAPYPADQIGESACDFFGVETMVNYLKTKRPNITAEELKAVIVNTVRFDDFNDQNFDNIHPVGEKRLNRIMLAHPWIRLKLGCGPLSSDQKYCGRNTGTDAGLKPGDVVQ